MFPVIDLGPVALQAAGLLLILSIWLGLSLTGKFAAHLGTNGDAIENGLLFGFLAGILAARVGFLLTNPTILQDNPLSIISLTPSMLDANFGILAGLLVALIIFQRKHLPLWPTLDTLSPLFILAYVGFQLANLANGNAYGLPTDLPWGVVLWNATRHPVQIYALILTAGLLIWWLARTQLAKRNGFYQSGVLFSITAGALALITLVTQAFVAEKQMLLGVDQIQLLALILLAASLFLIYKLGFNPSTPETAYISMGSNSDPLDNLYQGSQNIAARFKILRRSGVYQTKDVREGHEDTTYLNRILLIETALPYPELVASLKEIEQAHGRQPGEQDIIPLDLDVLTYGKQVFHHKGRQIPDPGLRDHGYILIPLAETTPDFRHPATGESIDDLISKLSPDELDIQKIEEVKDGTEG